MNKIISLKEVINESSYNYFTLVYSLLYELEEEYPNFNDWYFQKVVPQVISGDRDILLSTYKNKISGISIIKDSYEKKICTIRVIDPFKKKGFGKSLLIESMKKLNTEKPLITVSDTKYKEFIRIFNYFGYKKTNELVNFYKENNTEFIFNAKQ